VHDLPVLAIVNDDYAAGHVRSLRRGLAAMPEAATAVLVALADQPLLRGGRRARRRPMPMRAADLRVPWCRGCSSGADTP